MPQVSYGRAKSWPWQIVRDQTLEQLSSRQRQSGRVLEADMIYLCTKFNDWRSTRWLSIFNRPFQKTNLPPTSLGRCVVIHSILGPFEKLHYWIEALLLRMEVVNLCAEEKECFCVLARFDFCICDQCYRAYSFTLLEFRIWLGDWCVH